MERTRDRATIFIIRGEQLLVIYRKKQGREYYVLPGGGVEHGESPTEAAIREAWEETSLHVPHVRLVDRVQRQQHNEYFFIALTQEQHVQLGGPEQFRQSTDNIYRLTWVSFSELDQLNLQPEDIRSLCQAMLQKYAGQADR